MLAREVTLTGLSPVIVQVVEEELSVLSLTFAYKQPQ